MNSQQRWVVIIGGAILLLMTLFPPYSFGAFVSSTYGFLLSPPVHERFGEYGQAFPVEGHIIWGRLLLQYVIVGTATLLAYLLAGQKKTSQ